jgi:hypothetical protein
MLLMTARKVDTYSAVDCHKSNFAGRSKPKECCAELWWIGLHEHRFFLERGRNRCIPVRGSQNPGAVCLLTGLARPWYRVSDKARVPKCHSGNASSSQFD